MQLIDKAAKVAITKPMMDGCGPNDAMSPSPEKGAGRRPRVFILEDSPLISLDLEEEAKELGCEVVGPLYSLTPEASELAQSGDIDVAIIDLVLTNGSSDPIIRAFQARGVPVVICSGLMNSAVKSEYPDAHVLGKPHATEELRATLLKLLPA
jgi:DNA-binding response OmpR family regulator